jgi:hypothetical protein
MVTLSSLLRTAFGRYADYNDIGNPFSLASSINYVVTGISRPLTPQSSLSQNAATCSAAATGIFTLATYAGTAAGANVIAATALISLPVGVPAMAVFAGGYATGSILNMGLNIVIPGPMESLFDGIVQAGPAMQDYFSSYIFTGP